MARMGSIRFRPGTGISGLALSADGSALISVGKQVTAWNSKTGQSLWRDERNHSRGNSGYCQREIAFAKDRERFYTVNSGDQLSVWNAETGFESVLEFVGLNDARAANIARSHHAIDVNSDASRFVIGTRNQLSVCDGNGNVVFQVKSVDNNPQLDDQNDRLAFSGPYTYGRLSPNGQTVAVVTSEHPREIRLYDADQGGLVGEISLTAKVVQLCFSPDGTKIATTERDSAVRMYDVAETKEVWSNVFPLTNPFENYTSAIEFNPRGDLLAVAATDNRIHLIDPSDGHETGQLIGHDWYPWCLVFSADGNSLYSAGWEGSIRHWDVANRKQRPLTEGVRGSAVVAASPDGQLVAFVDDDGLIYALDAASREVRQTLIHPKPGWSGIVFSPDSRYLAAGGSNDDQMHVVIWDMTNGQVHREWDWPKGKDPYSSVEAIEFSPNGDCLAVAVFRQSRILVWDLTRKVENALLNHDHVYGLSFSPDGKTLASVGWDKTIRFWKVTAGKAASSDDSSTDKASASPLVEQGNDMISLTREVIIPKENGDERMYAVCYTHDAIATAHLDGIVRIWNPETLTVRSKFKVPDRFVFGAIRFSPDGQWLATGTSTGQVLLWEPWTGHQAYTAGRHESYVYTVGFGRDNGTMVSGGSDKVSYLWNLVPAPAAGKPDLENSWRQLSDPNAEVAYRAMWNLVAAPEKSVPLIAEKLRPVRMVFDVEHDNATKTREENDRLKQQKQNLIDRNPRMASELVVRRAISVLVQVHSKESIQVLEELATSDPQGTVGRYAKALLKK